MLDGMALCWLRGRQQKEASLLYNLSLWAPFLLRRVYLFFLDYSSSGQWSC